MNNAPSLFDDGQIGTGSISQPMTAKATSTTNLVDLLHDGFYIVFLLKNKYIRVVQRNFAKKSLPYSTVLKTKPENYNFHQMIFKMLNMLTVHY